MIGVMDCNNFFVSCERVFRPELKGKAVVVLSNNDGCAVSRSNEAKNLGVKMGEPLFKLQHWVDDGQLVALSSNYVLYGDMSKRVMSVARRYVPHVEMYSIDECFLDLEGISDVKTFGETLSRTVEQWTGIPVSIGIAPTKTLAKAASKFAKKHKGYKGCCVIGNDQQRRRALSLVNIQEVWGIGRRIAPKLQSFGIQTAADFADYPSVEIKRLFHKPGFQTWQELNGIPAIALCHDTPKKSLTCSRSFKTEICDLATLKGLIADFAVTAGHKLRHEGSRAKCITVFIATNRFHDADDQYANAVKVAMEVHTSDFRELVTAATAGLERIFRKGYGYKKAGVTLTDIRQGEYAQSLFDPVNREKQEQLLKAIDRICAKEGRAAIRVAAQTSIDKFVKHDRRTRQYTTNLNHVIVAKDLARRKAEASSIIP